MSSQEIATEASQKEMSVKMIITSWSLQNKRVNDFLEKVSNEQLLKETAPGRNTGIYLLGHLTAVNDGMLPLFGFGEKLYPQLYSTFLTSPDKSGHTMPSVDELKKYWNHVNETLTNHINALPVDEWFTRHTSVSAEDFAKEPHRNKLNVLLNRTAHQSYHLGQLVYLGEKKQD